MESIINSRRGLIISCLCALVFYTCAENDPVDADPGNDPVQQEPDDNPPVDDPDNPDQPESNNAPDVISQALLFDNAQMKNGNPPANSMLSDLKIDKDTINFWPGVKGRIRILNPDGVLITAVLVYVPGADSYHEVPIDMEESRDSISVFYVDLDPAGLDLPHEGGIVISPVDPNGNVIDEFEHPVHIDPPFDEDIGAGPNGADMSTCTPDFGNELLLYFWIYTTIDSKFNDAPGYPHTGSYEVEGCCTVDDNPTSVPCLGKTPNASVVVDNQYSLTDQEYIKLFDIDFAYGLHRAFNSYDPDSTDFCNSSAGYSFVEGGIFGIGMYSYTPANAYETFYNFIIHSVDIVDESPEVNLLPRIGPNENNADSRAFINCRYLVMKSSTEGEAKMQVFERQPDGVDWFD